MRLMPDRFLAGLGFKAQEPLPFSGFQDPQPGNTSIDGFP
jgi:hypothetical protein